ncbi:Uncharacterised protein [Shigella sonnei]|nr:Uncharacterised protein [Shigella sonnei]
MCRPGQKISPHISRIVGRERHWCIVARLRGLCRQIAQSVNSQTFSELRATQTFYKTTLHNSPGVFHTSTKRLHRWKPARDIFGYHRLTTDDAVAVEHIFRQRQHPARFGVL